MGNKLSFWEKWSKKFDRYLGQISVSDSRWSHFRGRFEVFGSSPGETSFDRDFIQLLTSSKYKNRKSKLESFPISHFSPNFRPGRWWCSVRLKEIWPLQKSEKSYWISHEKGLGASCYKSISTRQALTNLFRYQNLDQNWPFGQALSLFRGYFLPGRVKTVGLRYVLGVVPGSQLLVSYREVKSVLDFVFPSLTMI